MQKTSDYVIFVALIATILTNGIGISFKSEVFTHELNHARQTLSANPEMHLDTHRNSSFMDDAELDVATHLCLHAAGQYQPFYFIRLALIPPPEGTVKFAAFILSFLPDSFLDSPFHPPRAA